jgi:thiol:disulfide interchange protein DsbC
MAALLLLTSACSHAELDQAVAEAIAERLRLVLPVGVEITSVVDSQVEGLIEATVNGQTLFVSRDGQYLVSGELYRIEDTLVNISEEARTRTRLKLMGQLDESDMVVFSPPRDQVKATVTIFTDIDCGYCRKLHAEVDDYNEMGIAVRYLAYPRAGLESVSYQKAVSAWCSDDPQAALTLAKSGQEIERKTCANPVSSQYRLGEAVGVTGTPALVFEDGSIHMGYRTAVALAQELGIN